MNLDVLGKSVFYLLAFVVFFCLMLLRFSEPIVSVCLCLFNHKKMLLLIKGTMKFSEVERFSDVFFLHVYLNCSQHTVQCSSFYFS